METDREKPALVTRGDLTNAGAFEDLVPLGDSSTTTFSGFRSR